MRIVYARHSTIKYYLILDTTLDPKYTAPRLAFLVCTVIEQTEK